MDFVCKSCNEGCGLDHVSCHSCSGVFHYGCAGVMESIYRKWDKARKEAWKCSSSCKNLQSQNTFSPSIPTQQSTTLGDLSRQLSDLCQRITALTLAMEEQSRKHDEALATVARQGEQIVEQQKKIHVLEEENKILKLNVKQTQINLNNLDQYGRRCNIEIHGVQQRHNENVKSIVTDIGNALNLPVDKIDVLHRLKTEKNKRAPIIVRFLSRSSRDAWLSKRNSGLVSNNIVQGSDDQRIFINVNLTKYNKNLFWKCREFKKQSGYKYCWVNGKGEILLRKGDQTNILQIATESDIPTQSSIPRQTPASNII